ncbi:crotonase/enoyl-CoA hydratase family protein [Nocardioides caeni]|uniref:Crotonase/enoyl-CoA hydratase family protein n=1 Tax=Nocardioides caeni TaxID=574700 RepID=A0A4V4HJX0_9ACTN|nr:crotonase/enoyl-CoA hydratase family protein [Nocardioides caeni]THV12186.1 crotonase/enoyl-CoA hydratase family protein [Nocardioides caeni]
MPEDVIVDIADGICQITINRPDARNAVNRSVTLGIAEAVDELDARDDLSVGILAGAGGTFCAGMDLKAFLAGEDVTVPGRGLAGICERPPRKPLIAAVEGWALAGGCEIVLACDMVVAARDARFGIPEVKRGLVAGAGGLLRLPRRIPPNIANELALTGDPLDASRAHELGLVNHLTEPGEALTGARDLALRLTRNGPLAMTATKQILAESPDWPMAEAFERQMPIMLPVFTSEDAREGAQAFTEKRDPVWRNR